MSTPPPPPPDSGVSRRAQRERRPPKRHSSPSFAYGVDYKKADLKAKPLTRSKRGRWDLSLVNYDEYDPIVLLPEREIWQVFYQRIAKMREKADTPVVEEEVDVEEPAEVQPSPIPANVNVYFTDAATTSPLLHVSTDGTNEFEYTYTAKISSKDDWRGNVRFSCINPLDTTAGVNFIMNSNTDEYDLFEFGKHNDSGCRFRRDQSGDNQLSIEDPVQPVAIETPSQTLPSSDHSSSTVSPAPLTVSTPAPPLASKPKGKRVSNHRRVYFSGITTPFPYLHVATDSTNTEDYVYGAEVALDGWHGKIRFSCLDCRGDKSAGVDLIITPGGSYEFFEFGQHSETDCSYRPLDNPDSFYFHNNRIHI